MKTEKQAKLLKLVQIIFGLLIVMDVIIRYKAMVHPPQVPLPQVQIQKPKALNVVEYITQTGTVIAYNSVNLVARIKGYLDEILFVDGSYINKDSLLFVIEPEPYLAKVKAARAQVAALRAGHTYAQAEYERQQKMYKQNATSLDSVEKWLAQSEASSADVDKALADLDTANINYGYTHIKAPFSGRIGRHLVDVGNLVGNGAATTLATIEQLDPIYVYFNLNEIDWLHLREVARKRGMRDDPKVIQQVPVTISIQSEDKFRFAGNLDFVNTGLNSSTGTMELRALIPNKKLTLVPNLFVQIRMPITVETNQLTVPDTAILYDQIGAYLLTCDKNKHVLMQRVTLGGVNDDGQRTILTGLSGNDDVIVGGIQNATPGHLVNPVTVKGAP